MYEKAKNFAYKKVSSIQVPELPSCKVEREGGLMEQNLPQNILDQARNAIDNTMPANAAYASYKEAKADLLKAIKEGIKPVVAHWMTQPRIIAVKAPMWTKYIKKGVFDSDNKEERGKVALKHFKDYSDARDEMLLKTNFNKAPWFVVSADKKKATRIALISHLLGRVKYHHQNKKLVSENYGLVDPATPAIIANKLF